MANWVTAPAASHTPVDVIGLASGVSEHRPQDLPHLCADQRGGVKCWGSNSDGQLGDGSTTTRTTPEDVFGLTAM